MFNHQPNLRVEPNLSTQFDDANSVKLLDLKVEFNQDNTPVYSWKVPKEAVAQVAYQVLVATSKADIDNNIGDVWNSQQVKNQSSSNILHKGKPLKKGMDYYWKVRIWDNVSRTSNYSEMQVFKN